MTEKMFSKREVCLKARSILIYGRSRAGKTAQIGELAEHVMKTTGKKTRLYTSDKGGVDTIKPHIDLGIIDVVAQDDSDIFIFYNKAARGYIRQGGKWVLDPKANGEIGLYAFEGMTPFSDGIMEALAVKAGENVNIGGGANVAFAVNGDGETLKVSGNNMSHYNIAQMRVTGEVWQSQKLDAQYVLWTASLSRDEDPNSSGKVTGPAVAGKALTAESLRWFNLSFRIDGIPASQGKPERHILYLGNSVDQAAGNAVVLGNTRTPLGSKDLPASLEPASLVKAIQLIDNAGVEALEALKKRMGK